MLENKEFDLESLDLDSEIEIDDISKSKKSNNKNQKSNHSDVKESRSITKILVKNVLPAIVSGSVCFILGIMSSGGSSNEITTIKQIKSETSLSSRVNSIKDSELQALQSQLKSMTESYQRNSLSEQTLSINELIDSDRDLIEKFMTEALNDDGSSDRTNMKTRVSQFFLIDEIKQEGVQQLSEETQKINDNLNLFLNSKSLANQLNLQTSKVGISTISILFGNDMSHRMYQVIVPVATSNNEIHNVVYFVKVNNSKIVSASYAGQFNGLADSSHYFDALNQSISESKNSLQSNDVNISTGDQLKELPTEKSDSQ